jgi:hypothetical protein
VFFHEIIAEEFLKLFIIACLCVQILPANTDPNPQKGGRGQALAERAA